MTTKTLEGHDGPVSLYWLIREIPSYQTLQYLGIGLTLSQTTNFRLFQTKRLADDDSKFDENGKKLSKWVENNVGKGKIAGFEQFLLFSWCFQKTCAVDTGKPGLVWERVKT